MPRNLQYHKDILWIYCTTMSHLSWYVDSWNQCEIISFKLVKSNWNIPSIHSQKWVNSIHNSVLSSLTSDFNLKFLVCTLVDESRLNEFCLKHVHLVGAIQKSIPDATSSTHQSAARHILMAVGFVNCRSHPVVMTESGEMTNYWSVLLVDIVLAFNTCKSVF